MKHRPFPRLAAGAFAVALGAAAAMASAATSAAPVQATELPAERSYAGIRYVTGGVTADEATLFRRAAHDYPLAIELFERQKAGRRDEYTADALVTITRSGREVFSARAQGPFVLVRLDPGTYDISATLGKRTLQHRHVVVTKGRSTRALFEFPAGTD